MRDVTDDVSQFAAMIGAESDPLLILQRVATGYQLRLEVTLREHGLSPIGWCILVQLNERDGDNTTTLALRTTYERSSVAKALETLERKNLVRRSSNHLDRRDRIVHITRVGRDAVKRAVGPVRRMREETYAGLSAPRLITLTNLLGIIRSNLDRQSRTNAAAEKASSVG